MYTNTHRTERPPNRVRRPRPTRRPTGRADGDIIQLARRGAGPSADTQRGASQYLAGWTRRRRLPRRRRRRRGRRPPCWSLPPRCRSGAAPDQPRAASRPGAGCPSCVRRRRGRAPAARRVSGRGSARQGCAHLATERASWSRQRRGAGVSLPAGQRRQARLTGYRGKLQAS